MDLGSGLTFQKKTVNGKVVTGIFFGNSSKKGLPKLPIRSTVHPDDDGTGDDNTKVNKNSSLQNTQKRNVKGQRAKISQSKPKIEEQGPPMLKKSTRPSKPVSDPSKSRPTRAKSASSVKSDSSNKSEKNGLPNKSKEKISSDTKVQKVTRGQKKDKSQDEIQPEVNTKYVTLTQSQLNTILSLVKSSNDIDVTDVLEKKSDNDNDSEGSDVELSDEATLDGDKENKKTRPSSHTSGDNIKSESIEDLMKKKKSEKVKKSSSEKSKISVEGEKKEDDKKGSEKESESNRKEKPSKKDEPAVMKSSFFFGEATPRDRSAKKRENQQRWREELEQQRDEQRKRKVNERNARREKEDEELWTKHFDTMLPSKTSPRDVLARRAVSDLEKSEPTNDENSEPKSKVETTKSVPVMNGGLRRSIDNSDVDANDFASTFTQPPHRSNHLRTMTSLLDPAQIEALEVKRKKQEEHRRAIEAQVEERRKQKEEEDERRRRLEAEEDRRLAAERDRQSQKAEIEKAKQQMQESLREQQTRELYQRMKNAEESALRDKLARREQILRTKGHDTSRLELTHQMKLEMNQAATTTLMQPSQSSITSEQNLQFPVDGKLSTQVSPRMPVAVTAHTEQGPIKLEISLNHTGHGQTATVSGHGQTATVSGHGQLVESGVQTDSEISRSTHRLRIGSDSDGETEYLRLPPRKTKQKNPKLKTFEKDLNRQYEKHSRTTAVDGQAKQKRNQPRPKWGVGDKNRTFVPASQRYTAEQQRMRRREERAREPPSPERSNFSKPVSQRPKSPTVPAVKTRQRITKRPGNKTEGIARPSSGIYATSENAKYRSDKHTRDSPVPEMFDYVQYHRTTDVLDPSIPQSRPESGPLLTQTEFVRDRKYPPTDGDPLYNPEMVRQHERQEQILREISILRQGLLLKQREVASYPSAMTHSVQPLGVASSSLVLAGGGNLPERTNDTP